MHELETELTVAGGVGVPAGKRREHVAQPWALHDKGGETRVRHGGRLVAFAVWEMRWRGEDSKVNELLAVKQRSK